MMAVRTAMHAVCAIYWLFLTLFADGIRALAPPASPWTAPGVQCGPGLRPCPDDCHATHIRKSWSGLNLEGTTVVLDVSTMNWPKRSRVPDAAGCAAMCDEAPDCNLWLFCNATEGCGSSCGNYFTANSFYKSDASIAWVHNGPYTTFGPFNWPSRSSPCSADGSWAYGTCTLKKSKTPWKPQLLSESDYSWLSGSRFDVCQDAPALAIKGQGPPPQICGPGFQDCPEGCNVPWSTPKWDGINADGDVVVVHVNTLTNSSQGLVETAQDCERACEERQDCNLWVFCAEPNGCSTGCESYFTQHGALTEASIRQFGHYLDGRFGPYNWNQSGTSPCTADGRWPFKACSLKATYTPWQPTNLTSDPGWRSGGRYRECTIGDEESVPDTTSEPIETTLDTPQEADEASDMRVLLRLARVLNVPVPSPFTLCDGSQADWMECYDTDDSTYDLNLAGRVKVDTLPMDAIAGLLPQLKNVKSLDLSRNNLTGTLPDSWSGMTYLMRMNLSLNYLSNTLPPSWSNMSALSQMYLMGNRLEGRVPGEWGLLTNLEVLDISNNLLDGELPTEWSGMNALKFMNLSHNKFYGALPVSWASLENLQGMYLDHNAVAGNLPVEWWPFPSLLTLHLEYNNFTGTLPLEWWQMPSLAELDVSYNNLTGSLPSNWSSFINMQRLNLGHTNVDPTIPMEWYSEPQALREDGWDVIQQDANKLWNKLQSLSIANWSMEILGRGASLASSLLIIPRTDIAGYANLDCESYPLPPSAVQVQSRMVYLRMSGFRIKNCMYSGMVLDLKAFDLSNMVFQNNNGSGLHVTSGQGKIRSSTFVQNVGPRGGGIHSEFWGCVELLHSSSFIDNVATGPGGAVYLGERTTPEDCNSIMDNVKLTGNSAAGTGGGLYSEVPVQLQRGVFIKNSASGSQGHGGGLFVAEQTDIFNTSFVENEAQQLGGGIAVAEGVIVKISASGLDYNKASFGGGIAVVPRTTLEEVGPASILVDRTSFRYNYASSSGQQLYSTNLSQVFISCQNNATATVSPTPMSNLTRTSSYRCPNTYFLQSNLSTADLTSAYPSVSATPQPTVGRPPKMIVPSDSSNTLPLAPGNSTSGSSPVVLGNLEASSAQPGPVFSINTGAVSSQPASLLLLSASTRPAAAPNTPFKLAFGYLDGMGARIWKLPSGGRVVVSLAEVQPQSAAVSGLTTTESRGKNLTFEEVEIATVPHSTVTLTLKATYYTAGQAGFALSPLSVVVDIADCPEGFVRQAKGCLRCEVGQYSFDPSVPRCLPCPADAVCNGSTLVPLTGYWHSHIHSEQVHPCHITSACSRQNETQRKPLQLDYATFANTSTQALAVAAEYMKAQCNTGHTGVLCGQCEATYGHDTQGRCVKCPANKAHSWLLFAASILPSTCMVIASVFIGVRAFLNHVNLHASLHLIPPPSDPAKDDDSEPATPSVNPAPPPMSPLSPMSPGISATQRGATDIASALLMVGVSHVQLLTVLASFRFGIPESLKTLTSTLSDIVSSSGGFKTSLECCVPQSMRAPRSVYSSMIMVFVPVCVLGISLVISTLALFLRKRQPLPKLWHPHLKAIVLVTIFQTAYLFYPKLSSIFISMFDCVTVDVYRDHPIVHNGLAASTPTPGPTLAYPWNLKAIGSYWTKDTTVKCWVSGSHQALVFTFGIPGLVIFVMGLPLIAVTTLTAQLRRQRATRMSMAGAIIFFMAERFKPDMYFWECLLILLKVVVVSFVIFIRHALVDLVLCTLIFFIMSMSTMCLQPYLEAEVNLAASGSMSLLTVTFLISSVLISHVDDTTREAVAYSLGILNCVFLIAVGVKVVLLVLPLMKKYVKTKSEEVGSALTKTWQSMTFNMTQGRKFSIMSPGSLIASPSCEVKQNLADEFNRQADFIRTGSGQWNESDSPSSDGSSSREWRDCEFGLNDDLRDQNASDQNADPLKSSEAKWACQGTGYTTSTPTQKVSGNGDSAGILGIPLRASLQSETSERIKCHRESGEIQATTPFQHAAQHHSSLFRQDSAESALTQQDMSRQSSTSQASPLLPPGHACPSVAHSHLTALPLYHADSCQSHRSLQETPSHSMTQHTPPATHFIPSRSDPADAGTTTVPDIQASAGGSSENPPSQDTTTQSPISRADDAQDIFLPGPPLSLLQSKSSSTLLHVAEEPEPTSSPSEQPLPQASRVSSTSDQDDESLKLAAAAAMAAVAAAMGKY